MRSSAPRAAHPLGKRAKAAAHRRLKRRPVVATFHLRRALVLRVTVRELAPRCRKIGTYRFHGEKGRNRLRLPSRVHRTAVGAGTYALVGRTRAGRRIFHVVADVRHKGARVLAHVVHRAATCPAPVSTPVRAVLASPPAGLSGGATLQQPSAPPSGAPAHTHRTASGPPGVYKPPAAHDGDGGSPVVRAISLKDAPPPLRGLLYALLALAIGLLAAAAVPQRAMPTGPTAAFVAERRPWIAAAGVWLLVLVAVLTALT